MHLLINQRKSMAAESERKCGNVLGSLRVHLAFDDRRRSVGRRINLSFSTLEAHDSEFGEMTFDHFQRIHEVHGGDGPTEGETMSSPAAVELDFVSLFDAQMREQRMEKRRRTRNARGGFREELPDDDLITMLRSNQNIVADVSSITLTEVDPYVGPQVRESPPLYFCDFNLICLFIF